RSCGHVDRGRDRVPRHRGGASLSRLRGGDEVRDLAVVQAAPGCERGDVGAAVAARLRERGGGRLGLPEPRLERRPALGETGGGGGDGAVGGVELADQAVALARGPGQVLDVRERLVEVLRAEEDLERLDVPLLVEEPQTAGE